MHFHILRLHQVPIFEQLILEETLLRTDKRNFCILNTLSPPAAVMGISGKPEHLLNIPKLKEKRCPVIKRFSGGGTVVIDSNTLFVSLICNKQESPFIPYPEQILQWSENFYQRALNLPSFSLKENDFVLGNLKCGGNAQYITQHRWVQHTSFLWDFCPDMMQCLLFPPKTPQYRNGRSHEQFLCTLKPHFSSQQDFFDKITTYMEQSFSTSWLSHQNLSTPTNTRIATHYIDLP